MTHQADPSATFSALFGRFPKPTDDLMAEVYRAQHMVMARQMMPMGLINVVASGIVLFTMIPVFGSLTSLLWGGPLIFLGLLQIWGWFSFRGKEVPERVSGKSLRKGEWISLIAGLCWGGAPLWFGAGLDGEQMLFLQVVLAGMASGLVSLITPLPRHTTRFVLACLLPIVPSTILFGDTYNFAITCFCLMLTGALINSSLDSYRQLKKSLHRSLESNKARNNLIDAIESTNDAFALFDSEHQIVLMNERHKAWFGETYHRDFKSENQEGVKTIKHEGRWLLQSSHSTLDGGYVVVHTDITMIKARQRELQEARREAEEADLSKTRFLSTMSHELRMPLNLILGFSRLMASDSKVELNWDEVADYADNIRESGAHLLKLIDDIIDYSKIGLDKMLLTTTNVDLRTMLNGTVSLAASFEDWRDLSRIDINVSPNLGLLRIDETICQRILMNLISNAMRFSGDEKKLVIRAGFTAEGAPFIAVRDFGCGISDADLEHVFEAFYQVGAAENTGHGGTGLGLTLSQQLAQLHDGEIVLKSRVGVGTTAMLILPQSTHIPHHLETNPSNILEHVA